MLEFGHIRICCYDVLEDVDRLVVRGKRLILHADFLLATTNLAIRLGQFRLIICDALVLFGQSTPNGQRMLVGVECFFLLADFLRNIPNTLVSVR